MNRGSGALAVLVATVLVAASASWSATGVSHVLPTDAGGVSSFAFDPRDPNIVYVGTIPGYNKGRVYKTTDGGDNWRLISGRGWTWLDSLAADPRRRGTLYAGTGNAVYKTIDEGQSWRAFSRGLLPPPGVNRGEGWVNWLAVDPSNSNVLYEYDYAGTIRKSLDGGQSWHPVLSLWRKGGIGALLIERSRPPALYAALLAYVAGGTRWVVTLHDTIDGGTTWRKTGLSVSGSADDPANVALAADTRSTTIYVAVRNRVFSSTNAGRSWHFIGQGLPEDGLVRSLAAGDRTLYAAFGEKGIYETSDGGRTWTQSWPASGSAPGLGAGVVAVDPARTTTIYASAYYPDNRATGAHILRSTDGGHTWTVAG